MQERLEQIGGARPSAVESSSQLKEAKRKIDKLENVEKLLTEEVARQKRQVEEKKRRAKELESEKEHLQEKYLALKTEYAR